MPNFPGNPLITQERARPGEAKLFEAELNTIGMNPRLLESQYRLDANLDFTGGFTQFSSEEAPFYGSFDGNGHTSPTRKQRRSPAFLGWSLKALSRTSPRTTSTSTVEFSPDVTNANTHIGGLVGNKTATSWWKILFQPET